MPDLPLILRLIGALAVGACLTDTECEQAGALADTLNRS